MKRLILRGIDFGSVFVASGTLNFFGEGWPYHRLYKMIPGFNFSEATFIAKTTTLRPRAGNLPLKKNFHPKELLPKCILVDFRNNVVINAVDLSNPGLNALIQTGRWQDRRRPFFISFMATKEIKDERLKEMRLFAQILKDHLKYFVAKIGVEINVSCPNAGHDPSELVKESIGYLKEAQVLNAPVSLKINALIPVEIAKNIIATGLVDSLSISNTIPWGELPESINWEKLFGSNVSPLAQFGGGGLSGAPLLPIVGDWVRNAREAGIVTPIIAGGGILYPDDADYLSECGADAISIGSVAILRPWNVRKIIKHAIEIAERCEKWERT